MEEPRKPKPPQRAKTVHELRAEVKAKDKFAAVGMAEAEAITLISDGYQTDEGSARAFLDWLKGKKTPDSPPTRGPALESWHRQGDPVKGAEPLLSDEASAKARAPKGRKKR